MKNNRRGVIYTALATIICFLSVAYVSCTKLGKDPFCANHACHNGGYCKRTDSLTNERCVCPNGYEGEFCDSVIISKYLGTWKVSQKIIGSNDTTRKGTGDSTYFVIIDTASTPTTFYINNFLGNTFNNKVLCAVDSPFTSTFVIQPYTNPRLSGLLISGGNDTISSGIIHGRYYSSYSGYLDTFSLNMVRQ